MGRRIFLQKREISFPALFAAEQTSLQVARHPAGMQVSHPEHRGGAVMLEGPCLFLLAIRAADKAPNKPPLTLCSEISGPSSKHLKSVY